MFETSLHWTEYLKAVGPTLIALIVAYIAFQQWKLAQAKLRESLFDRRFEVFKDTQAFVSYILQKTKLPTDPFEAHERYTAFGVIHLKSRFLFGKDMEEYLSEIYSRSNKVRISEPPRESLIYDDHWESSSTESKENNGEREVGTECEKKEIEWLKDQQEIIFDKFEPYLSFEKFKQ